MSRNADPAPADPLRVPTLEAQPARALLTLPNWLGDIVMAAPTVAALRRAWPDTELVATTKPPFLPLARRLPGVDRVIDVPRPRGWRSLGRAAAAIRAAGVDASVCFPRGLRAQLPAWRAGVATRLGYGGRGRGRLLTHGIRGWGAWREKHRSAWFSLLARAAGQEIQPQDTLPVDASTREAARRLLVGQGRRTDRPLVILEPGASYGAAKCWPAARFGDLAAALRESHDVDVATVGMDGTKPIEARIAARAPHLLRLAGRTPDLDLLLGVLAEADAVVSNDTGPMHVAAFLGRPVVALFGASDPDVSRPLGTGRRTVLFDPEPCSPCFLRTCPIPGHPCLTKLAPVHVLDALAPSLS